MSFAVALLFFVAIQLPVANAADVSAKVTDGLGRSVENAIVKIYWFKSSTNQDGQEAELARLISDRNGNLKGRYDEHLLPPGEDLWVQISKDGYSGYTATGLQAEFLLKRKFSTADIRRIARLTGKAQVRELREFLAGDFDDPWEDGVNLIFVRGDKFRGSLRELLSDTKVRIAAGSTLAYLGVPEDVSLFIKHAPDAKDKLYDNRWAYGVVCALLEPTTEKEWNFLEVCATNRYNDLWVDAGAIKTLKLIASPRSKLILERVAKANPDREDEINDAIKYIDSNPPFLSDADLFIAGNKVAQAIRIGKWQGNKPPRFNELGDMAMIDCEFIAGRDLLVHTATFQKVKGVWKLRGERETMQALLARPLDSEDENTQKK